jgi:hypothetical protein
LILTSQIVLMFLYRKRRSSACGTMRCRSRPWSSGRSDAPIAPAKAIERLAEALGSRAQPTARHDLNGMPLTSPFVPVYSKRVLGFRFLRTAPIAVGRDVQVQRIMPVFHPRYQSAAMRAFIICTVLSAAAVSVAAPPVGQKSNPAPIDGIWAVVKTNDTNEHIINSAVLTHEPLDGAFGKMPSVESIHSMKFSATLSLPTFGDIIEKGGPPGTDKSGVFRMLLNDGNKEKTEAVDRTKFEMGGKIAYFKPRPMRDLRVPMNAGEDRFHRVCVGIFEMRGDYLLIRWAKADEAYPTDFKEDATVFRRVIEKPRKPIDLKILEQMNEDAARQREFLDRIRKGERPWPPVFPKAAP